MTPTEAFQPLHRHDRGLTTLEVLVALIVLAAGILPVAAASHAAQRGTEDAWRRTTAALLGGRRLDSLRLAGWFGPSCDELSSGAAVPRPGLRERWSIGDSGAGRQVAESLVLRTSGGEATLILRTVVACR
jgi:hypothetical protein